MPNSQQKTYSVAARESKQYPKVETAISYLDEKAPKSTNTVRHASLRHFLCSERSENVSRRKESGDQI